LNSNLRSQYGKKQENKASLIVTERSSKDSIIIGAIQIGRVKVLRRTKIN
jgi:hypothetical protein